MSSDLSTIPPVLPGGHSTAADTDIDPLADRRVLVTGGGGPAAIAVIRALVARGIYVAAVDLDPLAAGLRLADDGVAIGRYDDPSYVDELARVADKTGADILVSTLAEEVGFLHAGRATLSAAGLDSWLPDADAVAGCVDKWRFACSLDELGVPGPVTGLGSASGVPGPWVVKPRFGRGSRDIHLIDNPAELGWAIARTPGALVQTRLSGREFTVDALVDRGGALAGSVARWRLETKAGISVKGETFDLPELTIGVARLLRGLGLEGPANVQGFVDDVGVSFTEVNPRFSGALPLSLAAGADLVGEYLRGIVGLPLRSACLQARAGVRMVRYFEELFEG